MKGSPASSEDSPLAAEFPPSYDYATAEPLADEPPQAGPSTSSTSGLAAESSGSGSVPKNTLHFFSGPPNAEPLYGNIPTSLGTLGEISTHTSGSRTESWDPKLNDPQVLYDFIRYRARMRPGFKMQCTGGHWEHHQHNHTVFENGVSVDKRKGQSERIIDFDFSIDMFDIINHPDNTANVHLSAVAPDLPVLRGTAKPTYSALFAPAEATDYYAIQGDIELGNEATRPGKTASGKTLKLWKDMRDWRVSKGLPWWANALLSDEYWDTRKQGRQARFGGLEQTVIGDLVSRSISLRGDNEDEEVDAERQALVGDMTRVRETWDEPTLKAWCEAYTSSPATLKYFTLRKEVWGWDLGGLEGAVKGAIMSTGYSSNDVTVKFVLDDESLCVRPDNLLSKIIGRAAGSAFVHLLLWICMFFPILYTVQYFYPSCSAYYDVTRATYGLKYYPPLPTTFPAETVQAAKDRLPSLYKIHPEIPKNPTLARGPKGVHYLLGRKEGEFFREWEERIRMGVNMRFKGQLMGTRVGERESLDLDGY